MTDDRPARHHSVVDRSVPASHETDSTIQPLVDRYRHSSAAWLHRSARSVNRMRRQSAALLVAQWRSMRAHSRILLSSSTARRRLLHSSGAVALAGAVAFGAGGAGIVRASANPPATFTERTGAANPFDSLNTANAVANGASSPVFADIDGDGDFDAVIGAKGTGIYYYENTGTATAPVFTQRTGAANPFNGVMNASDSPSFVDLDNDGDLDLVVGTTTLAPAPPPFYFTTTYAYDYYENTGSATNPVFTQRTGAANPFNGFANAIGDSPRFVDIDNDGDMDAFAHVSGNTIAYYENTGTAAAPAFTERTGAANPFNGIDPSVTGSPTFADLDRDGDMDAFVGTSNNTIDYYENTGSNTSATFTRETGAANPFDGVTTNGGNSPGFVDIDADGDEDAFVGVIGTGGSDPARVRYFENTTTSVRAGNNAAEAGTTAGTFVITLNNPAPAGGATFNYTLSGTATNGADYTLANGTNTTVTAATITIAEGATSGTVQVVPVDDRIDEADETVQLTLANNADYTFITSSAEITIVDNDIAIYLPLVRK